MFKTNQTGFARNGSHGKIVDVYTNAVLFEQDNGTRYTLLNQEFTPDSSTPEERKQIAKVAAQMFAKCDTGFSYRIVRSASGENVAEVKPLK